MKLGIDVNRHKEIIVKAISGLLLLLLKHFKLNHVYQVRLKRGKYWRAPAANKSLIIPETNVYFDIEIMCVI